MALPCEIVCSESMRNNHTIHLLCMGLLLARPGQQLYPLAPEPDIVAPDLAKATEALVAASSGSGGTVN